MNKKVITSIAAVSVASVSYFSSVNSASAAVLTGKFQFDGADSPNTTLTLSTNSFTFNPNPGQINIKNGSATGTFASGGFTAGKVQGSVAVPGNSGPNPFIDLGGASVGDLTDGKNIFTISAVDNYNFQYDSFTDLWAGKLGFKGIFTGNDNTEISNGSGLLTFQMTSAEKNTFDTTGTVNNIAFSGVQIAAAAPVPESSSTLGLLGLSVVGAVAAVRKTKKLEM